MQELLELEKKLEKSFDQKLFQKAGKLRQEIEDIKKIENFINDTYEHIKLLEEYKVEDENELKEISKKIKKIESLIKLKELETYLNGKYDKGNAIISIYAGQGGLEAEDWVRILFRMYEKYCERKGFKIKILDEHKNEYDGYKYITFLVKGKYAYGYLKNESGVHRLVRMSPFSPDKLRHTSFALVEVLPELEETPKIKIKQEDLKIDFARAGGPGGQNVNMRATSVRIIHLPTGITVRCQSERNQFRNREIAMKILYSKLQKLYEQNLGKEKEALKTKVKPSWGNQIRNYIFAPYKLIKDLRVNYQTQDIEKILNGELDNLIELLILNSKKANDNIQ